MKNDNKVAKITIFALLILLVSIIIISITFAKYLSSGTSKPFANVALWSIEVNDTQIANKTASTYTFNLFDTILDEDGSAEKHVSNGLIAPGTSGTANIVVKNLSEVDASATIKLEVTKGTSIPLKFKVGNATEYTTSIPTIPVATLSKSTGTVTIPVSWKWEFNGNEDTSFGIDARTQTQTIELTATVTATQVD